MIDLYTWPTPNGRKISILLEELKVSYRVIPVDINKGDQFSKMFSVISPSNKIPAIIDRENKKSIFETGAIMLYLANKHDLFIPKKYYWEVHQWFFFQISQVGPFLGQAHQFLHYNKGKSKFAEQKYKDYVKRVYQTLEQRLKSHQYLGNEYSIADIATWPWIARHPIHDIGLGNYVHLSRWFKEIAKRPAVIKGYKFMDKESEIPLP